MKKLLFLALISATIFSCATPKTVKESQKVLKGYWTLNDVSYDRSGTFNITLFNDASSECLEGSTWRFIPNNHTGVYTVNNSGCSTGDRNFRFSIQEINSSTGLYDFMLKPTNAKGKSEDNSGFRIRLAQLSENSMTWEQTVNVEGKPFTISMNFSKLED